MTSLNSLRECFRHHDWAQAQVLSATATLSPAQLEQQFEMGPGSLLATLAHIYGAERIWLERWQGTDWATTHPHARELNNIAELRAAGTKLAQARDELLAACRADEPTDKIRYENQAGTTCELPLGAMLLHVCNHAVHHRAQVLNMLRHAGGVRLAGLDYLFMRVERPTLPWSEKIIEQMRAAGMPAAASAQDEPAKLDVATLRWLLTYNDWACGLVLTAARGLHNEQLDREFELGLGTARKTLLHMRDAEHWWYLNWTAEPVPEFQKLPVTTPLNELDELYEQTTKRREEYLETLTDDELERAVGAYAGEKMRLEFRLGESLLQLWTHGTHHRAQAVNMLRHLGVTVSSLDMARYVVGSRAQ